jgi:hypothetical protein
MSVEQTGPSSAELAELLRVEKQARLEMALLLKLLVDAVTVEVKVGKKGLDPLMTERESQHPTVDGMDAGTVTKNRGRRSVVVHDKPAFINWLKETHPSEVELVVRKAFWDLFEVSADGASVVAPNGEIDPPGLLVQVGEPYISVTPNRDASIVSALWEKHRGTIRALVAGEQG